MDFILSICSYFQTNILTQPAFFVGILVFLGYLLMKKRYTKRTRVCESDRWLHDFERWFGWFGHDIPPHTGWAEPEVQPVRSGYRPIFRSIGSVGCD